MDNPAVVISNPARLAALRRLALLDTPTEQAFDRLTRLAARILRAPIALISLVDADRQFFKSCVGLPEPWATQRETALVYSFCQHAVAANQPLIIADARTHPLVQDNPAIHDLDVVAYAGIPLITTDGYAIGTFCVIDRVLRVWTSEEITILNDLAAAVMTEIELRGEIIERQRAETELERFFALSYDLFCMVGTDGYFKRLNPAWEKTLGFSLDELMAEPYLNFIHPDDHAGSTAMTEQAISGLNPQFYENRYRCKDGSYKWLQWTGIFSADHQTFYSMARDVSERKRLEAQFLQAQKMESVGRLAGSVAHDFNNLLTTIIGYSELALDELGPSDLVYADLEEIQRMARRAAALTHQLLAFSRERIIEPQTLNLNPLVLDMSRLLRRLIGEHIELAIQTAPDLGPVKADPGQIEQLIVNLAMNARDAMPDGGKLTIETVNIYLDQQYVRQHIGVAEGPYVLLSISDTGSGMDEEVQRHIFEPFFTTKGAGKGSGIGLATCYGIVKQHGGHIWIYSEANRGTSINIYLPIVADGTATLRPREDRGDAPRGSETILLVEDEQTVRELTGRVLREQGYTVLEAANGSEALQAAASYAGRINLLLTDMVMPQMGGGVLAERFMVLYPDIRVLFMSGYTDNAIIHYHRATPAHAFLQKPFTPSFLARKVRDVLDS